MTTAEIVVATRMQCTDVWTSTWHSSDQLSTSACILSIPT